MTTAQNQAAVTKGFVLVAATLLCACGSSSKTVYRIDGATTDFCVPKAVDVTPGRPDKGKIISGGFAINGCWKDTKGSCMGPENLISLSVSGKGSFVGRRLNDFPMDAHVREVANIGKTHAKLVGKQLIAIPDSVDKKKMFVWSTADIRQPIMAPNDELMATCASKRGASVFFCDRKIVGRDYAVSYSFLSSDGIPTSFQSLDSRIVTDIETLRCPRE